MPASTSGNMIDQIELEYTALLCSNLRRIIVETLCQPPSPSPDATSRPRCVRLSTGRLRSIAAKIASSTSVAAP